jgi:hypothetical protein
MIIIFEDLEDSIKEEIGLTVRVDPEDGGTRWKVDIVFPLCILDFKVDVEDSFVCVQKFPKQEGRGFLPRTFVPTYRKTKTIINKYI